MAFLLLHNYTDFIPFSIILYYLTNKYRLQDAVIVHWLHNVLVYKFS